jgi:hypothetical protein
MSLILFQEVEHKRASCANELSLGTWFADEDNQVFVIVLDDRTHEKRILCIGHFYKPFIANVPPKSFSVKKILNPGTLLQISTSLRDGGEDAQ